MKHALLLFALLGSSAPVSAAIVLCPNTIPIADARHGSVPSRFQIAVDPAVAFDIGVATVSVNANEILIEQPILPGAIVPCSPGSALLAELTHPLEPGTYVLRWTVRRLVGCPTGHCEVERATFTHSFTVTEPLGCNSTGPLFDTLPYPPIEGSPVILLFSTLIYPMPTDPVVTVTGNDILITQTSINTGPPPPPGPLPCNSRVIELGSLAAGEYNVVWEIDTGFGGFLRYTYSFEVLSAAAVPAMHWTMAAILGLSFAVAGALVLRS